MSGVELIVICAGVGLAVFGIGFMYGDSYGDNWRRKRMQDEAAKFGYGDNVNL